METAYHIPALLTETINGLDIRPDGTYIDLTFGGGGHSRAILNKLSGKGRLFSFDQDIDAYHNILQDPHNPFISDSRWHFIHGNFRYLSQFADYYGITRADGILADLGVSFHHFDTAERGFSFRFDGALDMRMNRNGGKTAADIVNTYSEDELASILYTYGEIKSSKALARRICAQRQRQPIERTEQLAQIAGDDKKLLTLVFQALRIEVNDELGALRTMLLSATELLVSKGRIAVLTYHSLEDRIVKNFLRSGNIEGKIEKDFYGNPLTPFVLIEKGLTASADEVERNPRSRSAKLRIAEKK